MVLPLILLEGDQRMYGKHVMGLGCNTYGFGLLGEGHGSSPQLLLEWTKG